MIPVLLFYHVSYHPENESGAGNYRGNPARKAILTIPISSGKNLIKDLACMILWLNY